MMRGIFATPSPRRPTARNLAIATTVKHTEHVHDVRVVSEVDEVGEAAEDDPAERAMHDSERP